MNTELLEAYKKFKKAKDYTKCLNAVKLLYEGDKSAYKYLIELREIISKALSKCNIKDDIINLMALLKKSYILSSREVFEDFLIAIEWDKPYKQKFYLPRKYLKTLGIVDGYQALADGKLDVLTVSLPKRAGKTQMGVLFSTWLSGKRPDLSTLIEGAGDDLVNSFYEGILIYLDPKSGYNFYDIFPEIKLIRQKADTHIIDLQAKKRFPTVMCRSIDAQQVGLSEATNLLYLDDCVKGHEEAINKPLLEKKWETISGDIMGRMVGCPMIITGTRYSIYDPIGKIQEYAKDAGWRILSIEVPALDKNDNSNYEYYNPKLEKTLFTSQYFKSQRALLSEEQFMSEFQQEPFEAKGLLFKDEKLNRYFKLPIDKEPDSIISVCDTSEGGGDSVCMPVAYIYGEDVFIEDIVFDNSTPEYTKPKCARVLKRNNVMRATFESNSAGTYFARDVEELLKKLGGMTSIKTKRTISNKQTRIELASDIILKHFYFKDRTLYKTNSDYGRFMRELTAYTRMGKVKHDDAPDGLSLLANEIRVLNGTQVEIRQRTF